MSTHVHTPRPLAEDSRLTASDHRLARANAVAYALLCARTVKHVQLAALLVLASCGSSSSGGDNPTEDMLTYGALPEAAQKAFEAWKAQPVKDCAWEQAFPSLVADYSGGIAYTPAPRVDYAALIASNHGSPLVTGDNGELALIGPGDAESGFRTHGVEQTTTINGHARSVSIHSGTDNGICVVSLGGEELFRGPVQLRALVYLSFDPGKPAVAGTDLTAMRPATQADGQLLGAVDSAPLVASAMNLLRPDTRVNPFLATRFAITQTAAGQLFMPSTFGLRTPDAIRLIAPTGTTPFVVGRDIYGPLGSLQSLYEGGSFVAEFLYRFTDSSPDLVGLRVALSVDAGGKAANATAITAEPAVPFSDPAFLACFAQRHQAASFEPAQLRSPEFDEQFFGCEGLTRDGYAALAADATTRAAITQLALAGPAPFRGWDSALIAIAKRVYALGNELSTLGDSRTPALAPILAHWDTLRGAFADAKTRDAFAPALIETVFGWYFEGLAPSDAVVASIKTALTTAAPRFPDSTRQMLASLTVDLSANGSGTRALGCATALVGDRLTAVDHAVASVSDVLYSVDFVTDFTDSFLQDCPTAGQLASLETATVATNTFVAADVARGKDDALFGTAIRQVVDRALTERWTGDTFAALGDVLAYGVISLYTFCTGASQAVRATCMDNSLTMFSTGSGKLLAPATAARTAGLARELTAQWPSLDDATFIGDKSTIEARFFTGMWLGCSDDGFARAKTTLFNMLTALKTASIADRLGLETQLSVLVASSTCS
jgi:hypothetical protein